MVDMDERPARRASTCGGGRAHLHTGGSIEEPTLRPMSDKLQRLLKSCSSQCAADSTARDPDVIGLGRRST